MICRGIDTPHNPRATTLAKSRDPNSITVPIHIAARTRAAVPGFLSPSRPPSDIVRVGPADPCPNISLKVEPAKSTIIRSIDLRSGIVPLPSVPVVRSCPLRRIGSEVLVHGAPMPNLDHDDDESVVEDLQDHAVVPDAERVERRTAAAFEPLDVHSRIGLAGETQELRADATGGSSRAKSRSAAGTIASRNVIRGGRVPA